MNVKKEEKIEVLKQKAIRKSSLYAKVFSTPDGKEVLADLEEQFHNRTSIVRGDPYATHAMEGAREVVLFIKNRIEGVENADKN